MEFHCPKCKRVSLIITASCPTVCEGDEFDAFWLTVSCCCGFRGLGRSSESHGGATTTSSERCIGVSSDDFTTLKKVLDNSHFIDQLPKWAPEGDWLTLESGDMEPLPQFFIPDRSNRPDSLEDELGRWTELKQYDNQSLLIDGRPFLSEICALEGMTLQYWYFDPQGLLQATTPQLAELLEQSGERVYLDTRFTYSHESHLFLDAQGRSTWAFCLFITGMEFEEN